MEAIDQLNKKIDTLLKRYAALEAENRKLKDAVATQAKANDKLSKKLASLEKEMVSVDLAGAGMDEDTRENMRGQLDSVIGEIDKILHTLND